VKCSSALGLTAIFYDTIADPSHPSAASSSQTTPPKENATQLVIATSPL
jgi:hypothetical protein